MKRETVSDALNHIDESFICEAACFTPSESGGKEKRMSGRKLIKIALLAAVLMSLLAVSAFAVGKLVNGPEQAVKVARQELKKMQEIGLLSEKIVIKEEPYNIVELDESKGATSSPGRIWNHRYSVRSRDDKYSLSMDVDTKDGNVRYFHIEASGEEGDEKIEGREMNINGKIYYYYNNFDDIFRPDMTINEFSSLLAEYWGFSGYAISGKQNKSFEWSEVTVDGNALLSSLCCETILCIYFEGDQRGQPMFVTLEHYPGRLSLNVGIGHPVG